MNISNGYYGADYVSESNNNENKQDTNMKTENKKRNTVRLTESNYKKIVDELTKSIYDAEVENLRKTGKMYGRDAINSHYFRYEIMEDNVNDIVEMYGISYDNAVWVFQKAWNRAHDDLESVKGSRINEINTNRNVARLNESQLKQIIAKSVKNVLNEKYNVTNMTKGDWDERDATINTVTDFGEDEDYSEIQKWGGTFVDAITSVDKHLKLAKTNIKNLFNGNNEEKNGFYNDNDNESDYQYINHVEKCIDNARSTLLRLRNRRMMYRGLD